jgi:hypothetical protein
VRWGTHLGSGEEGHSPVSLHGGNDGRLVGRRCRWGGSEDEGGAGAVDEVCGTDAELVEVEAGADPAGGSPSMERRSRGEEDHTHGVVATRRGTLDHGSARRHSGMKSTRAAMKAALRAVARALRCGGPTHRRWP